MPNPLEVYTEPAALQEAIRTNGLEPHRDAELLLCNLGGGLLRFTDTVFAGVAPDRLRAQRFQREPEGHGPHFDVYDSLVDPEFPYAALFNLDGSTAIATTLLSPDLTNYYRKTFIEQNEAAKAARRDFGRIALKDPTATVYSGRLDAGSGFVLPQAPSIKPVVHNVAPLDRDYPGSYVKLLVPTRKASDIKTLQAEGYVPFDDLVTQALGGVACPEAEPDMTRKTKSLPARPISLPRSRRERGGGLLD
ncbi:MAG: hypothetical protein JWM81_99 [Candidatus Saccharibacteria bacterium]|nr:hypothetical protein [Candidatus Saccharibacteria bacterium]